jgi:hypothetical protein
MNDYTLKWNRLTMKRLPPDRTTFLLWMGLQDSDGGFPAVAMLWRDCNGRPYVMFHGAKDNWKVFFECEWQDMMWATIPMPEQARKKYEKDLKIKHRNGVMI